MPSFSAIIAGTGSHVPERRLTNEDLSKMVETSDEWITQRTGIKERRIAGHDETTASLATVAARRAIEAAGVVPEGTCTSGSAASPPGNGFSTPPRFPGP